MSDIYAAGDCAELRNPKAGRRSVEAVWYTGKLMGPVLAKTICGERTAYQQNIWFNSAKFFDIEYQVYGQVGNQVKEGEKHLYWEHTGGRKAVRIVYDAEQGHVIGFNLMGIRYRQEVCQQWIAEKAHIETVLQNLERANFDPEFFARHESEILAQYAQQNPGKTLKPEPQSFRHLAMPALIFFLAGIVMFGLGAFFQTPEAGISLFGGLLQGVGLLGFTIAWSS